MKAQHDSGSDLKANTQGSVDAQSARHLTAIRIVGTALFDYQVRKTDETRIRLECLASFAKQQGDIDAVEAAIVAQLLASNASSGVTL
ncbi:hypothetical protein [Pseudomonas sp. SG20052]|uniref:hypothetical protein n=1 Tax=Pseudomonas sp. SG20052 TaxID=3074147 RepID=UPI00287FF1B5|nr:hypothetical protein [Pseudomonas sp. SG20052]WNF56008.1 hypothetical protein RHP74_01615 [Pseudomonas sp. SG20052]